MDSASHVGQLAVVTWLAKSLDNVLVWFYIRTRMEQDHWLFALHEAHPLLANLAQEDRVSLLVRLHPHGAEHDATEALAPARPRVPSLKLVHDWWMAHGHQHRLDYDEGLWPQRVNRTHLASDEPNRDAWMTLFSLGVFRRFGRVRNEQNRAFLDFLHDRGWWHTISEVHPDQGAEQWMAILREYAQTNLISAEYEQWMDSFPRLYRLARWCDDYVALFRGLQYRSPQEARQLLTPAGDSSLSGSGFGFDAPTLHRTLRIGHNLVVRELLRAGVLHSETAQSMAYMPGAAVVELLGELGYPDLQDSQAIHDVLVKELGSVELASFGGDYDIPLILLAWNPSLCDAVWAWAERDESDGEVEIEEELV
jgi:hypothetical protein